MNCNPYTNHTRMDSVLEKEKAEEKSSALANL